MPHWHCHARLCALCLQGIEVSFSDASVRSSMTPAWTAHVSRGSFLDVVVT